MSARNPASAFRSSAGSLTSLQKEAKKRRLAQAAGACQGQRFSSRSSIETWLSFKLVAGLFHVGGNLADLDRRPAL